jgi:hypothetical protein
MTTAPARPDTVLTLLFGPAEQQLDTLTRAIATNASTGSALEKLPQAARDIAAREAAAVTAGLLDINLADLLLAGWREYQDLTSAARRTLAAPGSSELVQLATHRVTLSQQPYVAVLVDGHQIARVQIGLSVVFDLSAVLARVRAGYLAGVHAGNCDITATLAINDEEVASKQGHLDLPGEVALRREIRLLPAREYPPGASTAPATDDSKPWWQSSSWWEATGQP